MASTELALVVALEGLDGEPVLVERALGVAT
jgi:hypothetical protein